MLCVLGDLLRNERRDVRLEHPISESLDDYPKHEPRECTGRFVEPTKRIWPISAMMTSTRWSCSGLDMYGRPRHRTEDTGKCKTD